MKKHWPSIILTGAVTIACAIPICLGTIKAHRQSQTTWTFTEEPQILGRVTEEEMLALFTKAPEIATDETTEASTETKSEQIRQAEAPKQTETPTEYEWQPYDVPIEADLQRELKTYCDEQEIAIELVLAIAKTESEFTWTDGDGGRSIGYMQIQPQWWAGLAAENGLDIHDQAGNLKTGVLIIKRMLNSNAGDLTRALVQYNTGTPGEATAYSNKVFENLKWIATTAGKQESDPQKG